MNEHIAAIDNRKLASLERKFQVVRDLVTAVAMRFKSGLFLYGCGGVGKSSGSTRLSFPVLTSK